MTSADLSALIAWIGAHPFAAGGVIFAVAFMDSIVLLGMAVPAAPIFFAVGTLIGLGTLSGGYAIGCAALGAFCGDGLSFWFGHRYGDGLRRMWPFSRYPQWLDSGEHFFNRHGLKGILIARYVGAVRPFVPAIAGMLRMPLRRYVPASALAGVTWAILFIAPGWLFGASLELLSAVAGRLLVVVATLLAALALMYVLVKALYAFFAPRATMLAERLLAWSHRHPIAGRFSSALVDPTRPESASLAFLALLLVTATWGFLWLLLTVLGRGEPLTADLAVHQAMHGLRTPLADHVLAMLSGLGDWQVLGPASALVFAWLFWRRRHVAAWHWLAAIAFGTAAVEALGFALDVPAPPAATAVAAFSFPAEQVTLATIVYGFFAVLIARELPGRRRAWPYVLAALLVTALAFSRLYFGAHWLSDVLAGITLGLVWIALLGLAYRRRVRRSFWVGPLAALFFGAVSIAGVWHGQTNADHALQRFAVPKAQVVLSQAAWWNERWQDLPERRNDFTSASAWPMNVQYAGSLPSLRRHLQDAGWQTAPPSGWRAILLSLDKNADENTLPFLNAAHDGQIDRLVMSVAAADGRRFLLRLWPSPLRIGPERTPVWQGSVLPVAIEDRLMLFRVWRPDADVDAARERLLNDLTPWPQRTAQRSGMDLRVTLIRQP